MYRIKHTFATILLLLSVFFRVNAQSLVLCESYDEQGKPSGIYSTWDIKQEGGYIYLLYNQSYALNSGSWYLYIDYDWDDVGTYQAYETFAIEPESGKNWFVYDYKFKDTGKYKASVMYNGTELASTYFNINFAEGAGATDTDKEIDTYYYENSNIVFCNSVDDQGYPVGEATTFSMNGKRSVSVSVLLDNNRMPFKTTKMFVDIYQNDNAEVWDTFSIDVQPDWDYVKFVQTFTTPGNYFIDIYTGDDIFINTSPTLVITQ